MLMCGYPVGVHSQVGGGRAAKGSKSHGGGERIEAEVDVVYISYDSMDMIRELTVHVCPCLHGLLESSINVELAVVLAPLETRSRLQLALVQGQSSVANKQLGLLF